MSVDIYDLNCPFCEKVYKLPREKVVQHVGKTIYCRGCGQPFSVPPLPVFESTVGVVLDEPRVIQQDVVPSKSNGSAVAKSKRTTKPRPVPKTVASTPDPVVPEPIVPDPVVPEPIVPDGEDVASLPPPFSAPVLPDIADVIPVVDEPPVIDITTDAAPAGEAEIPPYRANHEHGVVAVDESASYFHDVSSSEGISASEEFRLDMPVESVSNDDSTAAAEPFAAVSDVELPMDGIAVNGSEADHSKPATLPTPFRLPADFNLDDVPIARALSPAPARSAVAPSLTIAPIDLAPIRKRLTFLAAMSVLIALLLGATLLALLGYIPHHVG